MADGAALLLFAAVAEPQGMTFTLGELKQKKAIQEAAPDDQLLRATMPQN